MSSGACIPNRFGGARKGQQFSPPKSSAGAILGRLGSAAKTGSLSSGKTDGALSRGIVSTAPPEFGLSFSCVPAIFPYRFAIEIPWTCSN